MRLIFEEHQTNPNPDSSANDLLCTTVLREIEHDQIIASRAGLDLVEGLIAGDSQVPSGSGLVVGCDVIRETIPQLGGASLAVDEHDEFSGAAQMLAGWTQDGWESFDHQFARLCKQLNEHGSTLIIEPSSMGMLTDAISTCAWARRQIGSDEQSTDQRGWSLMIDPVGWLVESMLVDASDHLRRFNELCVGCPGVEFVRLRSLKHDDTGKLIPCSLSEGELDPRMISAQLRGLIEHCAAAVMLDPEDLEFLE